MGAGEFKKVCLSVCVSVCLCVCASPLQSQITFDMLGGWQPNFQGLLNSSQIIFGQVTLTPGTSGSGPDPEKAGFCQIYLLRGFWGKGVVSHLFGIGTTMRTKRWERNFEFWPTAGENGAGRRGWPGGRPKFWNFDIFYIIDPSLSQAPVALGFMQLFDPKHPAGSRGTPGSWVGENQKSKLGYF